MASVNFHPQGSSCFLAPHDRYDGALITAGIVSLIAIGVIVSVGLLVVGWPVWVPVVVGVLGGLAIGCIVAYVARRYFAQEEVVEEDHRAFDEWLAGLNHPEEALVLPNGEFAIVSGQESRARTWTPHELQLIASNPDNFLGAGKAKWVGKVNPCITLDLPKPGEESTLHEEVGRMRLIANEINPGNKIPEEDLCLALTKRMLFVAGGNYAAVGIVYSERDLHYWLGNNPNLTAQDIVGVIVDMCVGLYNLHQAGYTHGDMQLGNVLVRLLEGGFRGALADFGQTRQIGPGQDGGMSHGHWTYSSPEQRVHQPSDVYGAGMVAACLLGRILNGTQPPLPVPDEEPRSFYSFCITGVRRVAGVFGYRTYQPQDQVHTYLDTLVEPLTQAGIDNAQNIIDVIKGMTMDDPADRMKMENVRDRWFPERGVPAQQAGTFPHSNQIVVE